MYSYQYLLDYITLSLAASRRCLYLQPFQRRRLFHDNDTLITAQLNGATYPLGGTIEMR
jgi:hypothetical protein